MKSELLNILCCPVCKGPLVLEVESEEWLCDLGFGSYGIREPMRLSLSDTEVRQDFDTFMLNKTKEHEYLLKALVEGAWTNQYAFDLSPQEWIDFAPANYLNSTHPDAVFVQKLLIVLHNSNGRSILLGDMLKTVTQGRVEKQIVRPEDCKSVLRDKFNLILSA